MNSMAKKEKTQKVAKTDTKETRVSMQSPVVDIEGKTVGTLMLPEEVFGTKVSPQLLSQVVRVYLANQRLGTRKVKTRADVAGSTKKVYRQKGTGRARHGSMKAPIYIGGGVAHGPRPADFSLSLSKKMRKKALYGVLSQKFQEQKMRIVRGLTLVKPKTKELAKILQNLQIPSGVHKILLVLPKEINEIYLSGRNIAKLSISPVGQIHAYQVIDQQFVIFMEEAIQTYLIKKDKTEKVMSENSQATKKTRSEKPISSKIKKSKSL